MLNDRMVENIRSANVTEIDDILKLAVERRRELFPDWDMVYLALPKNDPEERKRTIDQALIWLEYK